MHLDVLIALFFYYYDTYLKVTTKICMYFQSESNQTELHVSHIGCPEGHNRLTISECIYPMQDFMGFE